MNEIEKLNEALFDLEGATITRIFVTGNIIGMNFSNQANIRAYSYSYRDKNGTKYSTLMEANINEKIEILLDDCAFEMTPEIQAEYDLLQEEEWKEKEKSQKVSEHLSRFLEPYKKNLTVDKIFYTDFTQFSISFVEIDNFDIILHSNKSFTNKISIETKKYNFLVIKDQCKVICEKVEKDYKSFSSAAKSIFRTMAKELGYEQITGITYLKERDGWYESFNLQLSHGNPFFYFNYGIVLPEEFPMNREELRYSGMPVWDRLCPKNRNSFPAGNKKQIVESATLALELYKEQVVPWFESLTLEKIRKEINR